jgi:hypothetical protein
MASLPANWFSSAASPAPRPLKHKSPAWQAQYFKLQRVFKLAITGRDRALYQAKAAGRDRAVVALPREDGPFDLAAE